MKVIRYSNRQVFFPPVSVVSSERHHAGSVESELALIFTAPIKEKVVDEMDMFNDYFETT